MELQAIISKLRHLPNVFIDRGYLQGRNAVLEQFDNVRLAKNPGIYEPLHGSPLSAPVGRVER